jgi:hypothetical protein
MKLGRIHYRNKTLNISPVHTIRRIDEILLNKARVDNLPFGLIEISS